MNKQLGNIFKNARAGSGLSQEIASGYIKKSTTTLSKWENDESVPELGDVKIMCHLYDADWLMLQYVERYMDIHEVIPKVEVKEFASSILNLQTAIKEIFDQFIPMAKIAGNNELNEEEYQEWFGIERLIDKAVASLLEAKFSIKNKKIVMK